LAITAIIIWEKPITFEQRRLRWQGMYTAAWKTCSAQRIVWEAGMSIGVSDKKKKKEQKNLNGCFIIHRPKCT
jgi:hypothetical protein